MWHNSELIIQVEMRTHAHHSATGWSLAASREQKWRSLSWEFASEWVIPSQSVSASRPSHRRKLRVRIGPRRPAPLILCPKSAISHLSPTNLFVCASADVIYENETVVTLSGELLSKLLYFARFSTKAKIAKLHAPVDFFSCRIGKV